MRIPAMALAAVLVTHVAGPTLRAEPATREAVSPSSGSSAQQAGVTCTDSFARLYGTAANLGIVEIDPTKGTVVNQFAPPSPQGVADGLAYDGINLYYLSGSRDSNVLYGLDPDDGSVISRGNLPASSFRNGLAALGGYVFILDWSAVTQDITVWDHARGRVARTLDINGANPDAPLLSGGLAAASDPQALYVTTAQTEELLEIDPISARIRRRIAHGLQGALGVAVVHDRIYLGTNTSSELAIFSRQGQRVGSLEVKEPIGFQSLAGDALPPRTCTIHLPLTLDRR